MAKEAQATVQANGNVMDVQAPKNIPVTFAANPGEVIEAPTEQVSETPETTVTETEATEAAPELVAPNDETTVAEPPVTEDSEAAEETSPNPEVSPEEEPSPQASDSNDNPMAIPPSHTAQKQKRPIAAIIVAIVIAIALAAVTVFAYTKYKNGNKTASKTTPTNTTATTQATPKATSSDVDQATKNVDASLNKVNDTSDFSSTDLSDQALGLQ